MVEINSNSATMCSSDNHREPGQFYVSIEYDQIGIERLRNAAYPLVKLLQEDHFSNATVLVENDMVTLRFDAQSISYPMGL